MNTPPNKPPSIGELPDRAFVEHVHKIELDFGNSTMATAVKNAEEAIKAVLLVNGGSCVSMLAFIGTLASRDLLTATQLSGAIRPLFWFGGGILAAIIASVSTYFMNVMRANASHSKKRSYIEPFILETPKARRYWIKSRVFEAFAILSVLASVGLFAAGLLSATRAFSVLAEAPKPPAASLPSPLPLKGG